MRRSCTPFYRGPVTDTEGGGEWLEAAEACRLLGVGFLALTNLANSGELLSESIDGRVMFSRASVERVVEQQRPVPKPVKAPRRLRRKARPKPPPPSDLDDPEVLQQVLLLGKFLEAAERGQPGPCPVCGEVLRPREWGRHLMGHR